MTAEMESWKQEPVSPDWFEINDWVDYGDANILEDIDFIIKEEPDYSGWTESASIFDGGFVDNGSNGSSSPTSVCSSVASIGGATEASTGAGWTEQTKTSELLQEFEDVLTRALTPPDSPEGVVVDLSPPHQLQPFYHHTLVHLQPPQPQPPVHHQSVSNESSSVTEIDAIVNESFSCGDCASSDSGYEDPDWAPASDKQRARPYPSLEERKARKKEQNKNAATRYRQKKKQEIEVILAEEKELQGKNETLKAEVEEIKREMKYLKSLLRHMFKAKGMIR